jgi:hypothetical protein
MLKAYLCSSPNYIYGDFYVLTRQYRETVQFGKEYIFFNDKYLNRFNVVKEVYVPCGKCIQCVISRSKSWEIRSLFELQNYSKSVCLTLTYNDENLPQYRSEIYKDDNVYYLPDSKNGIINYKDVQDFVKRLRKRFKFKREIKYICSCEYGSEGTFRPHYHLILFNFDIDLLGEDYSKLRYRVSKKGTVLYKSPILESIWNKGFVDVGKVDVQSCRYVSQYCCKNFLKTRGKDYVKKILNLKNFVSRECIHASQGLGLSTFRRNYRSIIESNFIKYGSFAYAIPKYFYNKLETINNKLFQIVKKKMYDYWINFKFEGDIKKRALIHSETLFRKLNLFHSDFTGCLLT